MIELPKKETVLRSRLDENSIMSGIRVDPTSYIRDIGKRHLG